MLIEILTSLLIFSVGVVLLVQGLSQITKSSQNIRENYKAMLLVDNLLTRIYSGEQVDRAGTASILNKEFNWEIKEQNRLEGVKDILVKITWTSRFIDYKMDFAHKVLVF